MSYKISNSCIKCDNCRPHCPKGAIEVNEGEFWINPAVCDNCQAEYTEPQCVISCPLSLPSPYEAKKGRAKIIESRPITSPDIFANGKNTPFASAIVLWEACNVIAQRDSLNWKEDEQGEIYYQRPINHGLGVISIIISKENLFQGKIGIENFDIRAACMHLIYAAFATNLNKPWEEEFTISDRQIEKYLGLEKRKDLSKVAKLGLIKQIAQQPCLLKAIIQWPRFGKVKGFSVPESYLWHLLEIKHHFQEDESGSKHLVGLTFRVKAGLWAKYFLNKQACKEGTAFYQYGSLPKSVIETVMSIWQQHEGAARMMLWLLFKTRMGKEQRITVPTLMRIAYGEDRVIKASNQREERKRLLKSFEGDLGVLHEYGLKPVFDPVTYPVEIQPLWSKLADLPDDAEDALEFWTNDGSNDIKLTDSGPRGKWNMLMNARILQFDLPSNWQDLQTESKRKKQKDYSGKNKTHVIEPMSGDRIAEARKNKGWSQRELAQLLGKSQSWIRDVENGRFHIKSKEQVLLSKLLLS